MLLRGGDIQLSNEEDDHSGFIPMLLVKLPAKHMDRVRGASNSAGRSWVAG